MFRSHLEDFALTHEGQCVRKTQILNEVSSSFEILPVNILSFDVSGSTR